MIKIENVVTMSPEQYQAVIRGMRNPMNSWEKSDSVDCYVTNCDTCCYRETCDASLEDPYIGIRKFDEYFRMGENDLKLCKKLANGGPVHAKYRRMMVVYLDITAPLYWWKEFDTYKVGTVANSCSTMHKIHSKEFTLEDFSCEKLGVHGVAVGENGEEEPAFFNLWLERLKQVIGDLNIARRYFLVERNPEVKQQYWWQMIQLLPSSYNQKRTVMLNYEVLAAMYKWRKNHKLDEWREFCKGIETLPFSELITMEE